MANGSLVSPITMAPYTCWVQDSFKTILIDACDEYFQTNDCSPNKSCSKLITWIAVEITDSARESNVSLPDELEKVRFLYYALELNI